LPFRLLLYPVLCWYLLANARAWGASRHYLAQVASHRPSLGLATGLPGVLRHFAAFGESLLDKMLLWGGLFPTSQVVLSARSRSARPSHADRGD
jgi:predicted LPLAT superfamily acyltransferase